MASHLGSEILGSGNLGSGNPEVDRGCDLPGEGGAARGKEKQISILVVVVKNILPTVRNLSSTDCVPGSPVNLGSIWGPSVSRL